MIRAVVFDVFGTLLEITDQRRPFRSLLRHLQEQGRIPRADDVARLMSIRLDLLGAAELFGMTISKDVLNSLESDLQAELASIRVFHDTVSTINQLKDAGYQIGVCSNLALPYGESVLQLLPSPLDAYALSFAVGVVKPESVIYQHVCRSLKCSADEVLFIGDSRRADFEGPLSMGMHARHLCRNQSLSSLDPSTEIESLHEIPHLLEYLKLLA
ncbi:HAD family hydrolase [Iodobacter sp. CM08]|uniref:HAD family hydrolase n=1 Tax=Iodobacter sp. CM08 TaxID=3085902 RepID=UPI002980B773|nr:HAD family hydrolase [Iodobacter sp. CM08]MDW5418657.1 HAD family hydrolase [Iodobacter sp. CM08]